MPWYKKLKIPTFIFGQTNSTLRPLSSIVIMFWYKYPIKHICEWWEKILREGR